MNSILEFFLIHFNNFLEWVVSRPPVFVIMVVMISILLGLILLIVAIKNRKM